MQNNITEEPILIVGGGLVGLSLALALVRQQCHVVVLERQASIVGMPCELSSKVSALNTETVKWLAQLQLWSLVPDQFKTPFRKMWVWDDIGGGTIQFDSSEVAKAQLGYIVNNEALVAVLYQALKASNYCKVITWVQLKSLRYTDMGVSVVAAQGEYTGAMLVGADGRRSWVRSQLPLAVSTRPYPHDAFTAVVKTEKPHQNIAYQNFLTSGPLGVLPLSDPHKVSIVWSCNHKLAQELTGSALEKINTKLTNSLQCQLGHMQCLQRPYMQHLVEKKMGSYYYQNTILIGDAAHAFHPLAGQGANLGLADAKVLSELISKRLKQGGVSAVLRQYQRERQPEHCLILFLMRAFVEGFDSTHPLVVAARSEVMNGLNKIRLLKRLVMQHMKVT